MEPIEDSVGSYNLQSGALMDHKSGNFHILNNPAAFKCFVTLTRLDPARHFMSDRATTEHCNIEHDMPNLAMNKCSG